MNNHLKQDDQEDARFVSSRGRSGRVGKIYKQFYRKAWEEIPEFKEWLTSIPGERSKAYCKICEKSLHAHRLSLTKHTVSLKHMRMAQRKIQENSTDIYNEEECYEEEEEGVVDMEEGEVKYQQELVEGSDEQHMVRILKADGLEDSSGGEDMMAAAAEEITVGEEQQVVLQHGGRHHIMYTSPSSDHIIPSSSDPTGHTLIKILPKEKVDKPHITTHVLDISKGLPVAGLPVSLYQLVDGRWILLNESSTNGDGRCSKLTGSNGIKPGRYKLHFDTERYFLLRHQPTFYPFVEVVFDVCSPTDHNHVPLLLGPYGYTTYRGS